MSTRSLFSPLSADFPEQVTQWNKRVLELKNMFVNKKVRSYLAGVTVKGEQTPPPEELFPKKKKKKK